MDFEVLNYADIFRTTGTSLFSSVLSNCKGINTRHETKLKQVTPQSSCLTWSDCLRTTCYGIDVILHRCHEHQKESVMVKLSVEESLGDELVSSRFIERFCVSQPMISDIFDTDVRHWQSWRVYFNIH